MQPAAIAAAAAAEPTKTAAPGTPPDPVIPDAATPTPAATIHANPALLVAAPQIGPAPSTPAAAPGSTAAPSAGSATPSAQLAPALVQIAHTGGTHQITVRLDPVELGHVNIHITRAADGTADVQVTVERPDTLKLMLADQPQLHRALDAAGVPQDGRSLTLSLATPDPGGGNPHDHGNAPGNAGTGTAGDRNTGQGGGQADAGSRQGRQSRAASFSPQPAAASRWMRAGIDITA